MRSPSVRRRTLLGGLVSSMFWGSFARAEQTSPSYKVKVIEPAWIPVRDGIKLAGRLWLPEGGAGERFPVVLEYIPYRTSDRYRFLDDRWGATLAGRGIAFARVDIRGSGNSQGILADEYLGIEQQDGLDIIAWLAEQSWCNGAVGMRGISWGGFATLQVASLRPPALKAIMPMCATDMRFRNDAHYVGGLPGLTNLKWAAGFALVRSAPPDPAVVGANWAAMWRKRLEAAPAIAAQWLSHQSNDPYWQHGSVGLNPEAINCPTYIIDGWTDSYAQSAERLLRRLKVPRKAIFGPWGHMYPDLGKPGPGLDWASEEVRWWRHWLASEQNGIMDGPMMRYFIGYATAAETGMAELPGRWAAEETWPSPQIVEKSYHLSPGGFSDVPASGRMSYQAKDAVGLSMPEWIPFAPAELPRDQQSDDARSLVFDHPVRENLEVVGVPRLHLKISSDRPRAAIAARLCEVDAAGRSSLVTYGILNLCFRNGFEQAPKELSPHTAYDVTLELDPIAHRFKPGSTLRLALSDGLWPLVWPSPERATLSFDLETCRLVLPERAVPDTEVPFPITSRTLNFPGSNPSLDIKENPDRSVTITGGWPDAPYKIEETSVEMSGTGPNMELHYTPDDPQSCRWTVSQSSRYRRDDWDGEVRVQIEMTSTRTHFHVVETLSAFKDGKPFFERTHRDKIVRRFS